MHSKNKKADYGGSILIHEGKKWIRFLTREKFDVSFLWIRKHTHTFFFYPWNRLPSLRIRVLNWEIQCCALWNGAEQCSGYINKGGTGLLESAGFSFTKADYAASSHVRTCVCAFPVGLLPCWPGLLSSPCPLAPRTSTPCNSCRVSKLVQKSPASLWPLCRTQVEITWYGQDTARLSLVNPEDSSSS